MGRIDSVTDWSEDGFPFATSHEVVLAGAFARATRMTYVGELGWELMVPVADAGAAYDAVWAAGAELGLVDAGYHAIESLRLEKGYRAFPRELNPDLTPLEAGLLFATALGARSGSEKDFLGRTALTTHRDALAAGGPRRRVVSLVLTDPGPMLWGGELVLRDGEPAGQLTSAAYGATVGSCVGLALLRSDGPVRQADLDASTFEVDLAGERHAARVTVSAPLR
jgi:glycine cleavage system aminomethyltransferase T